MRTLLAAVTAMAAAGGLLMVVQAFRDPPPAPARPRRRPAWWTRLRRYYGDGGPLAWRRRLVAGGALGGGVLAWLVTGWLIAIVLVPAAALGLPYLLGGSPERDTIARLEALEEWVRGLSGVLTVGSGLEQAIQASARSVPEPIAAEVTVLAARLRSGVRTTDALLAFADDLDDYTGDYAAAALVLAARRRGGGLAGLLDGLAETIAESVRNRREIEAERARPRTSARWVTILAVGAVGALFLTGDYLAPYATPLGQLILLPLLAAYVGALVWMRRASVTEPLPRFLAPRSTAHAPAGPAAPVVPTAEGA